MNYLGLNEKRQWYEGYKTPRKIKVRKTQKCDCCGEEILKGSIALLCYVKWGVYDPLADFGKDNMLVRTYLHEQCIEEFEKYVETSTAKDDPIEIVQG